MSEPSFRLVNLSTAAKTLLTTFLLLMGVGYLVALTNIWEHHHDADLEPGLSFDDLRRVYHGLDKQTEPQELEHQPSLMEKMIRPDGLMRKNLEKGGEAAIRALTSWLRGGSKEVDFTRGGLAEPGDPSAKEVIAGQCIRCHNAADGIMSDVPYAKAADAEPEYDLVMEVAAPGAGTPGTGSRTQHLSPTGQAQLVQITHAHILAIPVFTLIIGGLFLMTGLSDKFKLLLTPLPMIAICFDFASWWLARPMEPFVYVLAIAGAVFGLGLGAQILCVFGSMWFGKKTR